MYMYLMFSVFTSRQASLLASDRRFAFFFMVFIFEPNKLTLSVSIRRRWVPFNSTLSWFSWTFLMVHSKGKLKSNGEKACPCFILFCIGCNVPLYFHSLFSTPQILNIWSIVDLLHWNQHLWSPVISSVYWVNIEGIMMDRNVCSW
jgi:hypothetical protein